MGWKTIIAGFVLILLAGAGYYWFANNQKAPDSGDASQPAYAGQPQDADWNLPVNTDFTDSLQRDLAGFRTITSISIDSLNSTIFNGSLFKALRPVGQPQATSTLRAGRVNPFAAF